MNLTLTHCPTCRSDQIKKVCRDGSGVYKGQTYNVPRSRQVSASSKQYETGLLAAVLSVEPDKEVAMTDLHRLPELFAFNFHISADDLRQATWFIVQRQAVGIEMVRVRIHDQKGLTTG